MGTKGRARYFSCLFIYFYSYSNHCLKFIAAFAFSSLYGITHIEQMNSSIFLVQFAVVLASRTVSTVLSLYVLNIKFKRFNNKLPNDDKQKKLGSQNLVAMEDELRVGGADAGLKPSMIPKLRIVRQCIKKIQFIFLMIF